MNEEQFASLSLVIGSVGSPQFISRLMDAVCKFVQLDHLAIDAVRGANRQKVSVGISVTNSAFDKAVAHSAGGRLAGANTPQRSGACRKPQARRLDFDLLDLSSRELEFYRRFGIIDGLELSWREGATTYYLDFYRTYRLGRLANSDETTLTAAAEMFASLIELHTSLCQSDFGPAQNNADDIMRAVVGLLGKGLTPRESAVTGRIAAGMDTSEIAREMGVMPATVITFRKRAYAKLAIGSRAELFARCFQLLLTAERRSLIADIAAPPPARAVGFQHAV